MNRRLVVILGAALCWGCDSKTPAPSSQPASPQALPPASQVGLQPPSATTQSAPPPQPDAAVFYQEDFQKIEIGEVPTEFLVLEGAFAVREMDGNRVLELPGEPLSMFGLLFGPSETDQVAVRARFNGTKKGRKFPAFGVGLGGANGYRLMVFASKDALELYKGEEVVAAKEYHWTPETWTDVLLCVFKTGDKQWKLVGNASPPVTEGLAEWMINLDTHDEPPTGRASLWGSPYAGTPIRFDDLVLTRTAGATSNPSSR